MEDAAKPNAVKKKKPMEKTAEELRAIDNVACYRGAAEHGGGAVHDPRRRQRDDQQCAEGDRPLGLVSYF